MDSSKLYFVELTVFVFLYLTGKNTIQTFLPVKCYFLFFVIGKSFKICIST
jgi:hypothetical protein